MHTVGGPLRKRVRATYQLPSNTVRNLLRISSLLHFIWLPSTIRARGCGCYYLIREQRQLDNNNNNNRSSHLSDRMELCAVMSIVPVPYTFIKSITMTADYNIIRHIIVCHIIIITSLTYEHFLSVHQLPIASARAYSVYPELRSRYSYAYEPCSLVFVFQSIIQNTEIPALEHFHILCILHTCVIVRYFTLYRDIHILTVSAIAVIV